MEGHGSTFHNYPLTFHDQEWRALCNNCNRCLLILCHDESGSLCFSFAIEASHLAKSEFVEATIREVVFTSLTAFDLPLLAR